jgi:menaquinone reductase, multiheme cytochrome c subunit
METHEPLPGKSTEDGRNTPSIIITYLKRLIIDPLRSGSAYFIAGLIAALFVGWVLFPMALYSKDEQVIKFSHAIHTNPDIVDGKTEMERCAYCHSFREDGTFTGIPKLSKCMECHSDPESPLGDHEEEKAFLEKYVSAQKEIPWYIYNEQPDCVYFTHIAHVKNGKLECSICHGDHGKSETLPVYEQNRISGYSRNIWGKNISGYEKTTWGRMKMDNCADCHTENGHEENNECFVCHK